jgi:hypothetical protein
MIAQKMHAEAMAGSMVWAMARAKDIVKASRRTVAIAPAVLLGLAAAGTTSCAAATAPGMMVVASSGATSGPGSMLVAFPASVCTGSDSAVFLDASGGFVGAVAPGTATYLEVPENAARLFVVSSRDVTAPRGTWFSRHVVERPGERVERGIVVTVPRADAKNCYRSATPIPEVVTFEAATQAAKNQKWLDVRAGEGTLWLDQHRARVDELLDRTPPAPKPGMEISTVTRVP